VDSEDSSPERLGAIKNPCGHFSSDDDAFQDGFELPARKSPRDNTKNSPVVKKMAAASTKRALSKSQSKDTAPFDRPNTRKKLKEAIMREQKLQTVASSPGGNSTAASLAVHQRKPRIDGYV
jgi:hypothetical protein